MTKIQFKAGILEPSEQDIITAGFARDTDELSAPHYEKTRLNWLAYSNKEVLVGAVTADVLWDWIYIDELWVDTGFRGQGIGKTLMMEVENYAKSHQLKGLWLWTQSWQAEDFYRNLGYKEFTRFPDFQKVTTELDFVNNLVVVCNRTG